MANARAKRKSLLETLLNRNSTHLKTYDLLTKYTRNKKPSFFPKEHSILAQRAEEAMSFQEVKSKKDREASHQSDSVY